MSEIVLLKGKGEDRFIFAKEEEYKKGKRRKGEKGYWEQYKVIGSFDLSETLFDVLASNKTGYTIEVLAGLVRDVESSVQKLKKPINRQIEKLYEGVENVTKPEYLK